MSSSWWARKKTRSMAVSPRRRTDTGRDVLAWRRSRFSAPPLVDLRWPSGTMGTVGRLLVRIHWMIAGTTARGLLHTASCTFACTDLALGFKSSSRPQSASLLLNPDPRLWRAVPEKNNSNNQITIIGIIAIIGIIIIL